MFKVYAPYQGEHIDDSPVAISMHYNEVDALIDAMHIEAWMWQQFGLDIQTIVNQGIGS